MGKKKIPPKQLSDATPTSDPTLEMHPLWDRPMTPKQLARFLQVSPSTLARQLRVAEFPRLQIAGRLRFVPREVLGYYRRKSRG